MKTLDEELIWLRANVENIARRHGMAPEEICDMLIEDVCSL